jgi:pimeloyl-ACP methyl ester carboxylesterase
MAKRTPQPAPPRAHHQHEIVDPRWLLKAGAAAFAVALLLAYLTLCWLFYQGQWQFALHPSRTVAQTPAALGLKFEPIRFGVDVTGTPQLSGWFIPSDSPEAMTALILHSGDGSIADALPSAQILNTAHLNVLLFDYRGFGASGGQHPTEQIMKADAASALDYLTGTRGIPLGRIIPFGQGIGASLATQLCVEHRELPALVLESPEGDIDASVAHDPRSKLVPTSLLLHEHFPLAEPLGTLATPKLIVNYTKGAAPLDARRAANPKMTVEFPHKDDVAYVQTLTRFFDTYVPNRPSSFLTPKPQYPASRP